MAAYKSQHYKQKVSITPPQNFSPIVETVETKPLTDADFLAAEGVALTEQSTKEEYEQHSVEKTLKNLKDRKNK